MQDSVDSDLLVLRKSNEGLDATINLLLDSYSGAWQMIGTLSTIFLAVIPLDLFGEKIHPYFAKILSAIICFCAISSTALVAYYFILRTEIHKRDITKYLNIKNSKSPFLSFKTEQNDAADENKKRADTIQELTKCAFCFVCIQTISFAAGVSFPFFFNK